MAWAERRSKGWRGRYRDGLGHIRTAPGGTFTHKQAALYAATEAEARSRSSQWDTRTARMTWGDWWTAWEPTRTVEESTRITDAERYRRHLAPQWARVPLAAISPMSIQTWVAQLLTGTARSSARPLKPTTVKRILTPFAASLDAAVANRMLRENPARGVRIGGGTESHERYLTKAEVAAVSAQLTADRAIAFRALAYTGLRWGELAGLRWRSVDVQRRIIRVTESWDEKARALKPYPKGRKPRTVPVPQPIITEWGAPGAPDAWVFSGHTGKRLAVKAFRAAVNAAAAEAGVQPFRLHDLRHTYASWLLQSGVPLAEVGRLLGHTSAQTTERYAHLADIPVDHIMQALA